MTDSLKKHSVYIVEDEKIISIDIENCLKNLGYDIAGTSQSGEDAVNKILESKPDVVLMDIMLKGKIDGIEASSILKKKIDIPVIFLTAYADESTLKKAQLTEAFGYILKPFNEKELHTTISMALYKHKMEKELKASREWLSTTMKSICEGIIAIDNQKTIKFINPAAKNILGYSHETSDEFMSKPLSDFFTIKNEKKANNFYSILDNLLTSKIDTGYINTILITNYQGYEIPVELSISLIKSDARDYNDAVIIFNDISERKKYEEEIIKSQKIESLGILAGGIAHDFNNYLTAILGNISLAKIMSDERKEIYTLLCEAERASLRVKDLTSQLLSFSKGGTPIKQTANIKEFLIETAKFALRGTNVACSFDIDDNLSTADIDKSQINQVINNLIINAYQSMPKGGLIKVSAENTNRLPQNCIEKQIHNKYIKISIEDQGIGIPADHLKNIFDPYFTTKQKGSGLGLSSSYSIINKHDGFINVSSRVGIGSIFEIYLPASEGVPENPETNTNNLKKGNGHILIMDDEQIIKDVMVNILTHMGYRVEYSAEGIEALELYKVRLKTDPFDLIIMDLTIPGGMGGKEAIAELRKMDKKIKVIVASGYSNDSVMADYKEHGFDAYITKPFKIEDINELIFSVLNK